MIRYVGWIKAKESEGSFLKKLGVEGKMKYNNSTKLFEHCNCTRETVDRLNNEIKDFYPQAFTALDLKKKQISNQIFWKD